MKCLNCPLCVSDYCDACGDVFNRDIVQTISVCQKCRDKSLQAFDKWAEEIRKKKMGGKNETEE